MNSTICVKTYPLPPVDKREVLRYAGARGELPEISALMQECIREAEGEIVGKVCYGEFPVTQQEQRLAFGFMTAGSAGLCKNLIDCDSAVIFGATIGIGIDRLIARYGRISPVKALLFQAIGAERIEALCDLFCEEISRQAMQNGRFTRPRFSPGYGDWPLEAQRDIFSALDCPRKIGLTLNESLLMSPTKSVTALIGIGKGEWGVTASHCEACDKKDCVFGEHYENN